MSKPVLSLDAFKAFAQSKDPNELYYYFDEDRCACGQYAQSLGMTYRDLIDKSEAFSVMNNIAGDPVRRLYSGKHVDDTTIPVDHARFGDLVKAIEAYQEYKVRTAEHLPNELMYV